MIRGETGYGQYSYGGEDTLLAYAPVGATDGWSLAVHASKAEMTASTTQGIILTVCILLAATAVAIPIAGHLAKSISRPINDCVQRMEALVLDDLHSAVPECSAKDETGVLLGSVKDLTECLNALIGDVGSMLSDMAQGELLVQSQCEDAYVGDFSGLIQSVEKLSGDLSRTIASHARTAKEQDLQADKYIHVCDGHMTKLVEIMEDIAFQTNTGAECGGGSCQGRFRRKGLCRGGG